MEKKAGGGEAHGETERMEVEGEPATGQVGNGEGRQLITLSPHPPILPSILFLFLFIAGPSFSLL